jgi:hypothetical protein
MTLHDIVELLPGPPRTTTRYERNADRRVCLHRLVSETVRLRAERLGRGESASAS